METEGVNGKQLVLLLLLIKKKSMFRYVPVFWVDDVYVYGMLTHLARDVKLHDVKAKAVQHVTKTALTCVRQDNCAVLMASVENEQQRQLFWNFALKAENSSLAGHSPMSYRHQAGDAPIWKKPVVVT